MTTRRVRYVAAVGLVAAAAIAAGAAVILRPRGPLGPILVLATTVCMLTAPLAAVTSRRGNRVLAAGWVALAVILVLRGVAAGGGEAFGAMSAVFALSSGVIALARERGGGAVWVAGVVLVLVGGPAVWALAEVLWSLVPHSPPPDWRWGEPGPFGGEGGAFYAALTWVAASILILVQAAAAAAFPLLSSALPERGTSGEQTEARRS